MKFGTPLLAEVMNLPGDALFCKKEILIFLSFLPLKENIIWSSEGTYLLPSSTFPFYESVQEGESSPDRMGTRIQLCWLTDQDFLLRAVGCQISEASPMKTEQFEQVSPGKPAWGYCMKGRKGYSRQELPMTAFPTNVVIKSIKSMGPAQLGLKIFFSGKLWKQFAFCGAGGRVWHSN